MSLSNVIVITDSAAT